MIDHDSHQIDFDGRERLCRADHHASAILVRANHQHCGIHHAADDDRVRNGKHWRRIDQNLVVTGLGPGQQFGEAFAGQQLGRVAGPRAGRDDVEARCDLSKQIFGDAGRDRPFVAQHLRQTLLAFQAQQRGHARTSHIGVDEQCPLARLRECDREIRHDRRLAVARFGARHHDALSLPIRERDRGSQRAEGLGLDAVGLRVAEHGVGSGTASGLHGSYHREHRDAKLHAQFIWRTEPVVEQIEDVDQSQSAAESQDKTDGDDQHETWRRRQLARFRQLVQIDFDSLATDELQFLNLLQQRFIVRLQTIAFHFDDDQVGHQGVVVGDFGFLAIELLLQRVLTRHRELISLASHPQQLRPQIGRVGRQVHLGSLKVVVDQIFVGANSLSQFQQIRIVVSQYVAAIVPIVAKFLQFLVQLGDSPSVLLAEPHLLGQD